MLSDLSGSLELQQAAVTAFRVHDFTIVITLMSGTLTVCTLVSNTSL